LCKSLKLKTFKYQKSLDTSVFRLIRFRQKVLAEFSLRWNYSPLKKRPPIVAGRPFCLRVKRECEALAAESEKIEDDIMMVES
jgi:hypothetical protein